VDDLYWAVHSDLSPQSRLDLLHFFSLLRLRIDVDKTPEPSSTMVILGVQITLVYGPSAVTVRLLPEPAKVLFWISELQELLTQPHLLQRLVKLVGRLSFACSSVWGAEARGHLRPLYARLSARPKGSTQQALACLDWWHTRLQSPPVRSLFLHWHLLPPIIAYSDAEGSGGLGLVLCLDSVLWALGSAPSPADLGLLPRKTQIHAYEMLGALAALQTLGPRLRQRRLLLFIDNQSALGVLRKGSCSSAADLTALAAFFHSECRRLHCDVHLFWVPSRLNPADPPSRGSSPGFGSQTRFCLRPPPASTTLEF